MNSISFVYLFLPVIIYLSTFINIRVTYIFLSISVIYPIIFLKTDIYYIYSIIVSLYITLISKTDFKEMKNKLNELKKTKEENHKILEKLKKQAESIKMFEKKNEIIYSIINILSFATNVENLKSIQKYIDKYLECETSLIFFTEEGAKFIYGKIVDIAKTNEKVYKTDKYTLINLKDKDKNIFGLVIHQNIEPDNAIELLDEISASLRKIYLFEITENMSQKDGLTGLYRRGIFNEKLNEEIIKAKNFKHTLGLMLVDIDHFKNINDTYGHQVGDEVLKEVSRIIKENVYETDFVARYGGEEFAIIMPRAQIDGSTRKAYYIKDAIASHKIRAGLVDIKVTISIGIAYYPYDALNPKELFEKADKALYFSKENGRNRITLYHDIIH